MLQCQCSSWGSNRNLLAINSKIDESSLLHWPRKIITGCRHWFEMEIRNTSEQCQQCLSRNCNISSCLMTFSRFKAMFMTSIYEISGLQPSAYNKRVAPIQQKISSNSSRGETLLANGFCWIYIFLFSYCGRKLGASTGDEISSMINLNLYSSTASTNGESTCNLHKLVNLKKSKFQQHVSAPWREESRVSSTVVRLTSHIVKMNLRSSSNLQCRRTKSSWSPSRPPLQHNFTVQISGLVSTQMQGS